MADKKQSKVRQSSSDTVVAVKRPYASPRLKEYGSLADLTRGELGFFPDTVAGSRKTPTF